MKPPTLAPSLLRSRFQPTTAYQLWTWSAILASILVCMLVAWLHFSQQRILSQMTASITTLHLARIELSKGFLYVTLATEELNSPFDREEGLAVLQQAADSLEAAARATGDRVPLADIATFRQSLDDFQARLLAYRTATTPQPKLETDLRIAFHDLENQADAIDTQSHQNLQELRSRLDFEFGLTLAGAALLLLGICSVMVYTGRAKVRADWALQERERKLQKLLELLPVGVSILNAEGQVVFRNPALFTISQMTEEKLAQGDYQQRTYLAGDGSPLRPEQLASAQSRATGLPVNAVETGIVVEDGDVIWTSVSAAPVDFPDWKTVVVTTDITQRKLAEAEMHASQANFATIFEHSPIAMAISRVQDGKITHLNAAFANLYGFTPDEMLGCTSAELNIWAIPADRRRFIEALQRERQVRNFESVACLKSGAQRHVLVSGELVAIGSEPCLMVQVVDITGRKQAEEALDHMHNTLAEAQKIAHLGSFEYIAATQTTVWSDEEYRIYGLEPSGPSPSYSIMLQKCIHPDDVTMLHETFTKALQCQSVYELEHRIIRPDGSVRWVYDLAHPYVDERGELVRYLGTTLDITERRRAEAELRVALIKYQTLFNNFPLGITISDSKGNILETNSVAEKLLGLSQEEQEQREIGGAVWRILRPDGTPMPAEEFASVRALNEGRTLANVEMGIVKPDGSVTWINVTAAPLPLEGYGVVITYGDITDRKFMEDELRRSNAELEQFAYVASHDLQEPLRAVAGMVQLLGQKYQGQLDARADEYIAHAVDAADRMQALITDLLAYSRVDRRGKALELVQVTDCLQIALRNLHFSIQESGAVVTADELPAVRADATQLVQLFQNLIGNAIKFRGETEPRIHIGVTKLNDAWRFSVRDNGIGIEAQYFERIFLVFQRLHTRREYAGTGIGLALCKKIVERHGGAIWVESQPGRGSIFYFTLPIKGRP